MLRSCALLLALLFYVAGAQGAVIPTSDPNIYWSDYNWYRSSSYAQSVNPGAYFKVTFTNSSLLALQLHVPPSPSPPTTAYMTLRYSLDSAPYVNITLPAPGNIIKIASGLSSNSSHTFVCYILNSVFTVSRWYNGPPNSVMISGLQLEDGGKTAPNMMIKPKRMLAYWDSIGEGVRTLGVGDALVVDDSTITWAFSLAEGLDAEISVIGFGSQGYTVTGVGDVAPLFTPGNDSFSAWDKYFDAQSRLMTGKFSPPPDYIFCGHGTNDYYRGISSSVVQASVSGWLQAVRAAAPSAHIFLCVPFGGFHRIAITQAFGNYTGDARSYLLDLGAEAQEGLSSLGVPSRFADDGLHPLGPRSGQLGGILAVKATKEMMKIKMQG